MEETRGHNVHKWLPEPLDPLPASEPEDSWIFTTHQIVGDATIAWIADCDTLAVAKAASNATVQVIG